MKNSKILLSLFLLLSLAPSPNCLVADRNATIELAAVGDVMLARGVQQKIADFGADYPFEKVSHVISGADIAFCNLECPVTNLEATILKPNVFGVKPQEAEGLSFAGFDIVSLANNHAMDKGREGLLATMEYLKGEGIQFVGAGKDYREARFPTILNAGGIEVGFLAYCLYPLEGTVFNEDAPSVSLYDPPAVREALKRLRDQVDVLVVSLHWGTEYAESPHPVQKENAHQLIDWGADLILGHHPHVLQEIQEYNGGVIVYSLGNFVFDQKKKETKKSMIFKARLSRDGVVEYTTMPVRIEDFRPEVTELSTDATDRSTDVTD